MRRGVLWATLLGLGVLITLSVVGAFLGAARAKVLFNSWLMVGYWVFLTLLLVVGIGAFAALRRRWGLLAMHVGAVLVLLGSMAGSERGHEVLDGFRDEPKCPKGVMRIGERFREDRLLDTQTGREVVGQLPFALGLRDFWVEYYETEPVLEVSLKNGTQVSVAGRVGSGLELPEPLPDVSVVRVFERFRMVLRPERQVVDAATGPANPALELKLTYPDGTEKRRYVFEQHAGHEEQESDLQFRYDSGRGTMERDYFSDLAVLSKSGEASGVAEQGQARVGEVLAEKVIEVNDPLHYGGYHFYQSGYGKVRMKEREAGAPEEVWYTELLVVSDTGWSLVFAGYVVLLAGTFWHCWLRHVWRHFARRGAMAGGCAALEASGGGGRGAGEPQGRQVVKPGTDEVGNFGEST